MSSFTVEAILQATGGDKFQQAFKGAQESLEGFKSASKKIKNTGKMMTAGLTLPIVGLGAAALNVSMNFEKSMSTVEAVSGAAGEELQMLEDKAREMGNATNFSASQAADGLGILAMSGMNVVDMAETLEPVLMLAGAAGLELDEAAGIVTNTLGQYGLAVDQAQRVTDVLAKGSSIAKTDVTNLGQAMQNSGTGAAAMGYDVESTVAVLSAFADKGLEGSEAGTVMNSMFKDMKNAAKDGNISINGSSVAIADANGEYRSFTDIVTDLNKATEGLTQVQRDEAVGAIMGSTAMKGFVMVTGDGIDVVKDYEKTLRGSKDAASDMYEVMNDNLVGSIERLKSALDEAGISLGTTLMPIIKKVTEVLKDWTERFNKLSDGQKEMIVYIALIVAAIGPLLTVIGMIAPGISAVAGALAFITGPIALGIAAFTALVAIGVAVYKNWDTIKEKAKEVWGGMQTFFTETIPKMVDNIAEGFEELPERINEKWNSIVESTKEWGSSMWESAKETGSNFTEGIMEFFTDLPEKIGYLIGTVLGNTARWGVDMWDESKEVGANFLEGMLEFFTEMPTRVAEFTSAAYENVTTWGANMWDKSRETGSNFLTGTIEFFKDLPQRTKEWLDKTVTNVMTWGSELRTKGGEAAQELVTGTIEKAKELPGKMMDVGLDLIKGLWNGINNSKKWVMDKVGGFMDGVLQGAKDAFGVKSPSREFMSIGRYLDEGLVKGILGGASSVHSAMSGMIDGVLAQGDRGMMMDIGGSIARSNGQVSSAVSHEINNKSSKSPASIMLNLGDRNYRAFVEDITNSQAQSISFEESY